MKNFGGGGGKTIGSVWVFSRNFLQNSNILDLHGFD